MVLYNGDTEVFTVLKNLNTNEIIGKLIFRKDKTYFYFHPNGLIYCRKHTSTLQNNLYWL